MFPLSLYWCCKMMAEPDKVGEHASAARRKLSPFAGRERGKGKKRKKGEKGKKGKEGKERKERKKDRKKKDLG